MEFIPFEQAVEIWDTLRKPINAKERQNRIEGKAASELYPYYGATGQVGYIDGYISDGEYVLLGEDGALFLNPTATKAYLIHGKAWVNNHAHVLRSKINNAFLCYYLNYFNYKDYVSGTTRLKLTQSSMKQIPIPSPPPAEQERIVARIEEMFSQLDASVAELKTAKERLKMYRQAVVTAVYPALTVENTRCLSELAEITGGITKGRKLENSETIFLPYLRVANVQNGYLDLTEVKQIELKKSKVRQYLLSFGDVLYTEGGDRDKLGRGTIWRNEIENCVHQNHVFKARIDSEKALPLYVAYWSMTTPVRNYFYAKGKQSVNLASINKTVLSALPIPLAPIEQQKRIVTEIEDKLSVCDSIEKILDTALQQAETLRQSILKKAFEGGRV